MRFLPTTIVYSLLLSVACAQSAELKLEAGLRSNVMSGQTNTFKVLMYPFDIDLAKSSTQRPLSGGNRSLGKSKIDTVFFLSDGRPSVGKYVDTNLILKEVQEINKVYRITFHAIAIGQFQKDFLRTLAAQNGGEFVDLGY